MDKEAYLAIKRDLDFTKSKRFIFKHVGLDIFALVTIVVYRSYVADFLSAVLTALVIGAFMFRSFSMMHEAVHGTLSENTKANNALGWIYGVFCALPFRAWRQVHLDHHLWTGNLDRDPSMKLVRDHRDGVSPTTSMQNRLWRAWLPYLAWRQQVVFWQKSIQQTWQSQNRWAFAKVVSQAVIIVGALVSAAITLGLWPTVGGVFLYLLLVELVNFPHHLELPQRHGSFRVAASDQYRFARTCLYPKWFSKYVLLNFNYHIEHHLYPNLPCDQLAKAHGMVRPTLGPHYSLSEGNQWIRTSRKQDLSTIMDLSIDWESSPASKRKQVG